MQLSVGVTALQLWIGTRSISWSRRPALLLAWVKILWKISTEQSTRRKLWIVLSCDDHPLYRTFVKSSRMLMFCSSCLFNEQCWYNVLPLFINSLHAATTCVALCLRSYTMHICLFCVWLLLFLLSLLQCSAFPFNDQCWCYPLCRWSIVYIVPLSLLLYCVHVHLKWNHKNETQHDTRISFRPTVWVDSSQRRKW